MKWLQKFFARGPRRAARPSLRVVPRLEALERRDVPAVTFHGGVVLPNVEVQALYYGNGWHDTTTTLQGYTPYQITAHLETELRYLVQSPFFDTLSNAGYGVGRGSDSQGRIYTINVASGSTLTDAAIRANLQYTITDGALQAPDANRLYVVFVQPNVVVKQANGSLSDGPAGSSFTGYHSAFAGLDAQGHAAVIHYVVIPTPGGAVNNASAGAGLGTFDAISAAVTRQLADAVTDPNLGYATKGWYDDTRKADVADAVNAPLVRLNGYTVAQVGNSAGAPLAAGQNQVAIFPNGGGLWRYEDALGWQKLTAANASEAVVDVNGDVAAEIPGYGVWRFEDAIGWQNLTTVDASQISIAGDGIVAVELPGNGVWRFEDAHGWQLLTSSNASQIGVDYRGDVVAELPGMGVWRFSTYAGNWAQLTATDASQVAIAGDGIVAAALPGHGVWRFEDAGGWVQLNATDPTHMALDASGDVAISIHGMGVWRYKDAGGWVQLSKSEATQVAIAGNGIVTVDLAGAGVWRYEDLLGWGLLTPSDAAFLASVA